jgi:hypothetical protein
MSNWIQLTSGGGYDFDKQILFGRFDLERDLAYPLAGENRYTRHTSINWAVAIHSVAVARTILALTGDKHSAAAGLLHDAHESVIGDIPTPVAWAIGYEKVKAVKEEVQFAIERKLGVPNLLSALNPMHLSLIKLADAAALHVERQMLMAPEPREWGVKVPAPEWTQTMHDLFCDIIRNGEHRDGGQAAFMEEWKKLLEPELYSEGD